LSQEEESSISPIDVLWIEKNGRNYYVTLGGYHRFAAHKQLRKPKIRPKLILVTEDTLKIYLGASMKNHQNSDKTTIGRRADFGH
jgi:sulfiredoxin